MTTTRGSRRLVAVLPLIGLILLGLLLSSPELLHAHRAGTPGLFSAECPLAEVAARHGEASLPSAPPIVATWWTVRPTVDVAIVRVLSAFVRSTDSRAPPLA